MTNCLVIGSGGREHALIIALSKSPGTGKLFAVPGNAGTAMLAQNVEISENDFQEISALITREQINLVVVGPEIPLIAGITDFLTSRHGPSLVVVGPGKSGARLEGSKAFSKKFMLSHGIPTAAYKEFSAGETAQAIQFLHTLEPPFVIKADGPAAGKGVVICEERKEAEDWVKKMLDEALFGESSGKVVIEQFIRGIEVSVFVLTDGKNYVLLPEAKDYKRIGDNDSGPNTGGMGSVSPVPFFDSGLCHVIEERIIKKTISGLEADGIPYKGFIFFGLMIDEKKEPWVIEYNCRMGDPETQSVMERIVPNWIEAFQSMQQQTLGNFSLKTLDFHTVSLVLAAEGYPGTYPTGMEIRVAPDALERVRVAGAIQKGTTWCSKGGRVMAVTGCGKTLAEAIEKSYALCGMVDYPHKYFRKDIGKDVLPILQK
jgi:phosphoribosylamine--glycine ligase